MKKYARRAIMLDFSPDDLRFDTFQGVLAFQQALGRTMMQYLQDQGDNTLSTLNLHVVKRSSDPAPELIAAYFKAVEDTRPELPQSGTPFVIGGIPHDENGNLNYSFHS